MENRLGRYGAVMFSTQNWSSFKSALSREVNFAEHRAQLRTKKSGVEAFLFLIF